MAYRMWDNPEQAKSDISKAENLDWIAGIFSRLFNLGNEQQRTLRKTKADAFLTAYEQSQKVTPGTLEAAYASAVIESLYVDSDVRSDSGLDLDDEAVSGLKAKLKGDKPLAQIAYDSFRERGKKALEAVSDIDTEEIALIKGQIADLSKTAGEKAREVRKQFSEEWNSVYKSEEYESIESRMREDVRIKGLKLGAYLETEEFNSIPYDERKKTHRKLQREYDKFRTQRYEEFDKEKETLFQDINSRREAAITEATKEEHAEIVLLEAKRDKMKDRIDKAVRGFLLESSPATEEQAEQWVENNVHIAENALSRLKKTKSPYNDMETLKTDMREFFRLIGGKVGVIKIVSKGGKRAYANKNGKEVAIDSGFTKTTLFHELAHHVEFDSPAILGAARHFRDSRAGENAKPQSLRKLAHRGYNADEIAMPDHFFDPYVGKVYKNSSTEVVSMGLQQLASPDHVLALMAKDPEHLEMMIGLAGFHDPSFSAWMNIKRSESTDQVDEEARKEAWDKELKRVASKKALEGYLPAKRGEDKYPLLSPEWRGRGGRVQLEKGEWANRFDSIQKARTYLYLFLANEAGLLPEKFENEEILNIASGFVGKGYKHEIPAWFTVDTKLPKLDG